MFDFPALSLHSQYSTPAHHHGNIALILTNKQTFSTMNFQSLWLNEQWLKISIQQKCYEAITGSQKNQSMPPYKWWTTTSNAKNMFSAIDFGSIWNCLENGILKSKSKCRKYRHHHRKSFNKLVNMHVWVCVRSSTWFQ